MIHIFIQDPDEVMRRLNRGESIFMGKVTVGRPYETAAVDRIVLHDKKIIQQGVDHDGENRVTDYEGVCFHLNNWRHLKEIGVNLEGGTDACVFFQYADPRYQELAVARVDAKHPGSKIHAFGARFKPVRHPNASLLLVSCGRKMSLVIRVSGIQCDDHIVVPMTDDVNRLSSAYADAAAATKNISDDVAHTIALFQKRLGTTADRQLGDDIVSIADIDRRPCTESHDSVCRGISR